MDGPLLAGCPEAIWCIKCTSVHPALLSDSYMGGHWNGVKTAPSSRMTPEMRDMDEWLENWLDEMTKAWTDEVSG